MAIETIEQDFHEKVSSKIRLAADCLTLKLAKHLYLFKQVGKIRNRAEQREAERSTWNR